MAELCEDPVSIPLMQKVKETMDVARLVPVTKNLWDVQNVYFDMVKKVYPDFMKIGQETGGGAGNWVEAFQELGEALEFDYDAVVEHQRK